MYQMSLVLDGVTFDDSVVAPITITNGRPTLDRTLCQFYSNATVFRAAIQSAYTTAGKDIRLLGKGTPYQVKMLETGGAGSGTVIFDGIVTDTSSTADTITFTAVDVVLFKLSNGEEQTYTSGTKTIAGIIDDIAGFVGYDCNSLSAYFCYDYDFTDSNFASRIDEIASNGGGAICYVRTPTARTTLSELHFRAIADETTLSPPYLPATVDLELDDNDIDKSYNLSQNATDLYNRITVEKTSGSNQGSLTVEDLTSIAANGTKQFTKEVFIEGSDLHKLANSLLRQKTARGWGTYELGTSYDRISAQFTDELDCYETLIPGSFVEFDNVSEPYLQDYAFLQQVTHRFYQKHWQMSLFMADYRLIARSQRWDQVTATLEWGNVDPAFTWDVARSLDL